MAAAWNDVPATGGLSECAALVRSAEALRTSAPELSVQLARRALLVGATDTSASHAHVGEARSLSMRAQAVLAAGLVRTSQHVSAVEPGFAALGLAESGGALVLAAELRLDLAACAQEVGEPLLGGALLRPVLEATSAPPSVRAAALGRLVGCVAHVARRDDIEDALAEADRLLAADDSLAPDARRMERARLAVRSAAYHRWYGDNEDAVNAARDGLTLLSRLRPERRPESDRLHSRLVLEQVCALLDEGELHEAETAARPTVDEPVRATSAESVGQLMLALATRIHLPAGEAERGRGLVDQAAWLAERHGLDSVLADALTEVSRLDEQAGRAKEALEAMRAARAAEQRRMRAVGRAARHLLLQVTASQGVRDATQQAVASLLRQLAHPAGVPVAVAPSSQRTALPKATQEPQSPPITGELVGATEDTAPPAERTRTQGTSPHERTALHERPASHERTGLLNREDLVSRLRSARKGDRPVALTLVRVEPNGDSPDDNSGPDTGIMVGLADKVRDIAPENAELARSDGGELAVLLPSTTRDEAEEFAATIRETATRPGWASDGSGKDMSISTSVVQSDPQATDTDPLLDADTMLAAARDALTPTQTGTHSAPATPTAANMQALGAATSAAARSSAAAGSSTGAGSSTAAGSSAAMGSSAVAGTSAVAGSSAAAGSKTTVPDSPAAGVNPARTDPSVDVSLAETKAALSALPQHPSPSAAAEPPAPQEQTTEPPGSTSSAEAAASARTEDPPTTPLNVAQGSERDSSPAGRSILNSLSIPSGSGGRRRAGGEQAPGTRASRPSESVDAPRLTRAERRASERADVDTTVETGWPAEPDVSQALYRTRPKDEATATASSYEETRAELARMMSSLNAKALRARSKATSDQPAGDAQPGPRQTVPTPPDPDEMPEPPSRPDIPEPPRRPDIPKPPDPDPIPPASPEPGPTPDTDPAPDPGRAPDFGPSTGREPAPEPSRALGLGSVSGRESAPDSSRAPGLGAALGGESVSGSGRAPGLGAVSGRESASDSGRERGLDPVRDLGLASDLGSASELGPAPDPEPLTPAEPEERRSGLLAAFDALKGPVLSTSDDDRPAFRTEFDTATDLPSRRPRKSWTEIESASVVDSPADDLFGGPVDGTPRTESRLSLGAAFKPSIPSEPPVETGLSSERRRGASGGESEERRGPSTSAELRAALWERLTTTETAPETETSDQAPETETSDQEPETETSDQTAADEKVSAEVSATVGERSAGEAAPAGRDAQELGAPSGDVGRPSGASETPPTYDEPIGPQPAPDRRPRRGERSATTIASLLTEALAAYQSGADDQQEPTPTPERFDSFVGDSATPAGRHRSPE